MTAGAEADGDAGCVQALRRCVRQGAVPAGPEFSPVAFPGADCNRLCVPGNTKGLALLRPSAETLQDDAGQVVSCN